MYYHGGSESCESVVLCEGYTLYSAFISVRKLGQLILVGMTLIKNYFLILKMHGLGKPTDTLV